MATANPPDPAIVFELYRLSVEMADRTSARRAAANGYFLTLQTALAGAMAFLAGSKSSSLSTDPWIIGIAATAGIVVSLAWWLLLRSYRDLSAAKFKVIGAIEREHLPIEPFNDEWQYLKGDRLPGAKPRYAELGFIERFVPFVFIGLYVALAVRLVII